MPDTQERPPEEIAREMDSTADEMERHSEGVGETIADAKQTVEQNLNRTSEIDDPAEPVAAGDYEDDDPDTGDEDPAGFDDPESLDLEDEDPDDDGHDREEEA